MKDECVDEKYTGKWEYWGDIGEYKYEENSIIELTRIVNNSIVEDLNLKVSILQIGESIIRVEKVGEKRSYMNVPKGRFKMSFTTEVGKISIYLCPDENNSSRIKVELDEENQEKFSRLKDKSSLGKNCLLGGKNVFYIIYIRFDMVC
ncbi:hypothetical protein [Candidatus Mesenet endosymbiont of Phosphuga atrata]|uniref:hypothetical protein n=1 Tax=Candidatus Mesenet endosymbiont of Phosphuga atrata TaxID=3066221 RepID=UPI0030CE81A2